MLKDSSTLTQLATWNPARGVWETNQEGLMCGHLEPYSQTWPTSGSMRNGVVWERPTLEPLTDGTGSSSLPGRMFDTPDTMPEAPNSGSNRKAQVAGLGNQVRSLLLGTPQARDAKGAPGDGFNEGNLARQGSLLPTPKSKNNENRQSEGYGPNLGAALSMLPTPTAERPDARKSDSFSKGRATFYGITEADTWGNYSPAITRWEALTGHPAPPPTETGPKGNPRLSPAFVEWMMGLPTGHVTGVGISRVAQLTALGNGVVPQQAAAAIRLLLERVTRP